MAKTKTQELAVIDFTQFSVAQLPELKGKKEEIASVIEANPIVEIVDNATYESAKKSRTAVRTLRTSLESEQKTVKKRIKENVLDVVDKEYDSLVALVKGSEQLRQSPIDVWETKKEEEKQEKARLEQQRIDGIKTKISDYVASWKDAFGLMTFEKIQEVSDNFQEANNTFDKVALQEFDVLFDREVSILCELLDSKISTLREQEQIRIDNLLIQEKNAEQSLIQEWQRTWNANIDTLSVSDISDVKSILVKSKLANLKHYVSGYEEIYNSTEKRLHSQIEFVSKAEEQRIAQEKLDQEKKDFEEKQAEAKFQGRVKQLTDLGIDMAVFELEHEGDPRWMNLKNSAQMESDSDWEETLAWVDMQLSKRDKASSDEWLKNNPIEEIEVVADEVVELPALEVAFEKLDKVAQEQEESYKELQGSPTPTEFSGIFPEPSVVVGHGFGKDAHISVYGTNDIQEVQFDNTWNGVNKLFEKIHYSDSGFSNNEDAVEMRKLIFEYLEKHFNVPTLKQ